MLRAAEAARAEFASIVGEARVCYDERACATWRVDGMTPSCIVYPGSVEQVAEALKCASEHDLAVIAVGGGTKLETGNPPRKYDIALSLRELNKVRYYEPPDLTVGVEAGMTLDDFESLVNRDGLWLPLDPPGGAQGTIGGIVATNASGPMRHFYGAPRDMVLGMRIATTDGKLIKAGGRVVKNVAGYDLGKLLIGSYGTLGIIVEVNFKLYPIPAERRTFVLQAGTLGIARDVRRSILHSPIEPLSMVLLDAGTAGLLQPDPSFKSGMRQPEIWMEVSGSGAVMERTRQELEALGLAVGVKMQTFERERVRRCWESISNFAHWAANGQPGTVVVKATIPLASSEEFLSLAQQEATGEKISILSLSHCGAGILFLGLVEGERSKGIGGLIARLRKASESFGGALTVVKCSHGLKSQLDVWGTAGDSFGFMKKLKAMWDPKGILAPGRFVGSI